MLTGTRSSLVATLAGAGFALVAGFARRANRRALAIGAATLAAVALAGVAILSTSNPLNRRLANLADRFARGLDTRSASVSERALTNIACAQLVAEAPWLGHGPGMFDARFHAALANLAERDEEELVSSAVERLEEKAAGDAHNDYAQTWAECGTMGLAGFLLFAVAALWPFESRDVDTRDIDAGAKAGDAARGWRAAVACQAAMAATLALALVSFPLQSPERAWFFWACAAHALAARGALGESDSRMNEEAAA